MHSLGSSLAWLIPVIWPFSWGWLVWDGRDHMPAGGRAAGVCFMLSITLHETGPGSLHGHLRFPKVAKDGKSQCMHPV